MFSKIITVILKNKLKQHIKILRQVAIVVGKIKKSQSLTKQPISLNSISRYLYDGDIIGVKRVVEMLESCCINIKIKFIFIKKKLIYKDIIVLNFDELIVRVFLKMDNFIQDADIILYEM